MVDGGADVGNKVVGEFEGRRATTGVLVDDH